MMPSYSNICLMALCLACFSTPIKVLEALVPSAPYTCHSRTLTSRRKTSILYSKESGQKEESDNDTNCASGFYQETGPDGDYCVVDYSAMDHEKLDQSLTLHSPEDHYWDALASQNKARKKFGLPPLTLEQYVALQAENHKMARQQIADTTARVFSEFDKDNDGVITLAELHEGLEEMMGSQLRPEIVEKVLYHFDTSGDGVLQSEEFVSMGELRKKLEVVTREFEEEAAQVPPKKNMLQNFLSMFEDTCSCNYDCERPEVCCDFGYKKMCCDTGEMARELQLEYVTVPIPQSPS